MVQNPSPSTCVQRSSGPVLEQAARGDCERSIRGDIQVATGCTVAVPLPRSSPLTHPPILPPEFIPPCRIPTLCYYCNYFWPSIVVFTAHYTNKRDLIPRPRITHNEIFRCRLQPDCFFDIIIIQQYSPKSRFILNSLNWEETFMYVCVCVLSY